MRQTVDLVGTLFPGLELSSWECLSGKLEVVRIERHSEISVGALRVLDYRDTDLLRLWTGVESD